MKRPWSQELSHGEMLSMSRGRESHFQFGLFFGGGHFHAILMVKVIPDSILDILNYSKISAKGLLQQITPYPTYLRTPCLSMTWADRWEEDGLEGFKSSSRFLGGRCWAAYENSTRYLPSGAQCFYWHCLLLPSGELSAGLSKSTHHE